ncbi:MAG: YbbR-like domain-containing protein [Bryobacteraceae bacterium]
MKLHPVFQNLRWKLLALAIAVGLWAAFVSSPELVTFVSAPLQYQNMPQDLEMSADAPERVYLEVRGLSARLRSFDPSRTAVVLNLSAVQHAGEYTFTVDGNHVDLPVGLRLERAVPGQVRLRFEHRVAAQVPVRVRLSGAPPEGYRVARQQVRPRSLTIVGPETRVKRVEYVETDPIDLARAGRETQFHVHTFIPDPQVRFVSPSAVDVVVSLERTR